MKTKSVLPWFGSDSEVSREIASLLDADKTVIAKIEEDYVPNEVVPGSYGDYIEMEIAADGTVTNWPKRPSFESFFGDDD